MSKRADDFQLETAIADRGFSPGRRDFAELVVLLSRDDESVSELAEKALIRIGPGVAADVAKELEGAVRPLRARLCRVLGRVGVAEGEEVAVQRLLACIGDADAHAERVAMQSLGRMQPQRDRAEIERRLIARLADGVPIETTRTIATALGKLGAAASLTALTALASLEDRELVRIVAEAKMKLERSVGRATGESLSMRIDASRAPSRLVTAHLHCRAGLAELVAAELPTRMNPRVVSATVVSAMLNEPLDALFVSRIMLDFSFPLPTTLERSPRRKGAPSPLDEADDPLVDTVCAAVGSNVSRAVIESFTVGEGRVPYRIEWRGRGHQRSRTFRCAHAVDSTWARLRNDPTASLWELLIDDTGEAPTVLLRPRGLDDPRFDYRLKDVPASSHPTIAAALARIGGARADDVVWDPFVGAASELIERARMGPAASLMGSDLRAEALEAALANVTKAGLTKVKLVGGDARKIVPDMRPTLILTNPPMGRRILDVKQVDLLLTRCLGRFAEMLLPGGRLVWASPNPALTRDVGERAGLRCTRRISVDMGGFDAEIQRFDKPAVATRPAPAEPTTRERRDGGAQGRPAGRAPRGGERR